MPFEPIRRVLTASITHSPASKELLIARVFSAWTDAVGGMWGKEKSSYAHPVSFREGIFIVETTSPAAKQELARDAARLKSEMNRIIGSPVVRDLRCRSVGF